MQQKTVTQNNEKQINKNIACSDDAWWRWCAVHEDDKLRIARRKQGANTYKIKKKNKIPNHPQ